MTTTLDRFAYARAANYCTLPTIDVEILPNVRHCAECGETVTFNYGGYTLGGDWQHDDTSKAWEKPHRPHARPHCVYCHTDDPAHVTYVRAEWSDETRCTRCGGTNGYPIGD